jgi:hypothetical protein
MGSIRSETKPLSHCQSASANLNRAQKSVFMTKGQSKLDRTIGVSLLKSLESPIMTMLASAYLSVSLVLQSRRIRKRSLCCHTSSLRNGANIVDDQAPAAIRTQGEYGAIIGTGRRLHVANTTSSPRRSSWLRMRRFPSAQSTTLLTWKSTWKRTT